ncbi:hypothetical protein YC2023_020042 [Brassica napus]
MDVSQVSLHNITIAEIISMRFKKIKTTIKANMTWIFSNLRMCVMVDCLFGSHIVEGVLQKIRRQIEELERISGVESTTLTVDGVPVDSYLTSERVLDLGLFN